MLFQASIRGQHARGKSASTYLYDLVHILGKKFCFFKKRAIFYEIINLTDQHWIELLAKAIRSPSFRNKVQECYRKIKSDSLFYKEEQYCKLKETAQSRIFTLGYLLSKESTQKLALVNDKKKQWSAQKTIEIIHSIQEKTEKEKFYCIANFQIRTALYAYFINQALYPLDLLALQTRDLYKLIPKIHHISCKNPDYLLSLRPIIRRAIIDRATKTIIPFLDEKITHILPIEK